MSDDPLFDALSTLSAQAPDAAVEGRTQRVAARSLGRSHLRWAGIALAIGLALACASYLVVLLARAAALY